MTFVLWALMSPDFIRPACQATTCLGDVVDVTGWSCDGNRCKTEGTEPTWFACRTEAGWAIRGMSMTTSVASNAAVGDHYRSLGWSAELGPAGWEVDGPDIHVKTAVTCKPDGSCTALEFAFKTDIEKQCKLDLDKLGAPMKRQP